jgi:voltage-gated potassium channel
MSNGDYFGFMSLTLDERRTASIKAVSYCEMLVLDRADFGRIKKEFPEFTDVLKRVSAERSEQLSELVMDGIIL